MPGKLQWMLIALALAGSGAALTMSANGGAWLSPDSVNYLHTAHDLLSGMGISTAPESGLVLSPEYFAPGFPIVLASLASVFHSDPLVVGRWLNAILFGLSVYLSGWFVWRGNGSRWLGAISALVVLSSVPMLISAVSLLTEALFITLGLIALTQLVSDDFPVRRTTVAICLVALAFLMRYIGIAIVLTGMIESWIYTPGSQRRKLAVAGSFGLLSSLPMATWIVYSQVHPQSTTYRVFAVHVITPAQLLEGIVNLSSWLLPGGVASALGLLSVVLTVAAIVGLVFWLALWVKRYRIAHSTSTRLIQCLVLFSLIYTFLMVFSISFVDATIQFDPRDLLPVCLAMLIVIFYLIRDTLPRSLSSPQTRVILLIVAGTWLSLHLVDGVNAITLAVQQPQNPLGPQWRNSAVLSWLTLHMPNAVVVTNGPEIFYLYGQNRAIHLPLVSNPITLQPNPNVAADMAALRSQLIQNEGVIVYWPLFSYRHYFPDIGLLTQILPLQPLFQSSDGSIYQLGS